MKDRGIVLVAIGGGAGRIAERMVRRDTDGGHVLALDTDAVDLAARQGIEVLLLGESRFEGSGAGGDPVNGRLAVQDDIEKLRRVTLDAQVMVLLVCLGGGTGTGAAPEVLRLARQAGVATLCFATLPFAFEGQHCVSVAQRAVPVLQDTADALVVLPNDSLYAGAADLPILEAMEAASERMESGLLLFRRMLRSPGYVCLDVAALRGMLLHAGGICCYADISVEGDDRAAKALRGLLMAPTPLGEDALNGTRAMLVGILGGEDMRLREIGDVMEGLASRVRADCHTRMGTVIDSALDGRLAVVVLAFDRWQPARGAVIDNVNAHELIELPVGGRRRRPSPSKLSFGATGRGRFKDVEPTVLDGEDMDIPTYLRRGIALER